MNFLSKEILLSDQRRITGQAKFTYSLLGKAFEKQIKTMENRGIFPKDMKTNEIKNETDEIKKWEEKIKQKYLKYKTKNCTYDFQQYERIRSFLESTYTLKASIDEAEEDQSNLLENLVKFNNKSIPKKKEGKYKKDILVKVHKFFIKADN